eukprot:scaffold7771_cov136-Skeletonema_dohrnii-CCMP3373.AAC.2
MLFFAPTPTAADDGLVGVATNMGMGAADPAANVAAFRADLRIAAINLTVRVTADIAVDLDVDEAFLFVVAADGKRQTILLFVNKSSLVEMTDIIGILFFFVVLI